MIGDTKFHLTLCGVIELRAPSGQIVTPRLRKAQALLAYLALAGERAVERNTLQDLLWADRMPRQARDSLKQALSEIRRAFAEARTSPLHTDGGPVRLSLDELEIDALSPGHSDPPALLEGFSIREAPFLNWLLTARAHLNAHRAPLVNTDNAAIAPARFLIGIMPIPISQQDNTPGKIATLLCDGISFVLSQSEHFQPVLIAKPDTAHQTQTDLRLMVTPLAFPDCVILSVKLVYSETGAIIWSATTWIDRPVQDPTDLFRLASEYGPQICDAVLQGYAESTGQQMPPIVASHAITQICSARP